MPKKPRQSRVHRTLPLTLNASDFEPYEGLLEFLETEAKKNARTPAQEIVYRLKQRMETLARQGDGGKFQKQESPAL